MGVYETNMSCMKEYKEKFYKLINEIDLTETNDRLDQVYSVDTIDGNQSLVIHHNTMVYRLNSLYAPNKEAEYWAEQFNFKNMENVVAMFGLGNGVFAKEIVRRIGEDGLLFIYEPSYEIFMHVLHNYDITELISNKYVIIAIEDVNAFDFHHLLLNSININNLRCQIMCVHPYYDSIFEEKCVWFWKELKDINIHAQMNINALIVFGRRMIENTLNNIKYITNSNTIMELKTIIPKGVPAIVVSAGPSVRYEIEYLKQAKGKAVIIAVDRIIDYLLDEGVEPDIIATIDPKKPIQYFSRRTDIKTPLLCFMESNYEIFDAHIGRKIICHCSDYLGDIYEKNNKVPPKMYTGSSVATLAFMACIEMGFENIILVGQDLAYDGDLSHAGSINEADDTRRDILVEGIDGKMIRSRLDWKEFIMWYTDMIKLYPNITVIDAKEKGAKIKGAFVMNLRDALEKYCNKNENYIFNIEDLELTFVKEVHKDIIAYFNDSIETLHKIRVKTKNAIKACNVLMQESKNNIVTKKSDDSHRKLNNTIDYIVKQQVYRLMDIYITATSAQNLTEIYEFTEDVQDNSFKTYRKSKQIFESMMEAIDYIEPRLAESIKNL